MLTKTRLNDALVCDHLHFSYGYKSVLSDINLRIPAGAVVGLIGSNGAGKSTLLRCMAGLAVPHQGEVRLFDTPAMQIDDGVRERLGFVAQSPDLFPWMSVENHIRFIGQAYPKWRERRALELALRLRLPMGREVSQLSGGDQQKLAVVLALAHQPDLVLLDEPVSNLDPMTRRDFMRSLFHNGQSLFAPDLDNDRDAHSEPIVLNYAPTIIISSHLLSDLERVVSHVAFMRSGEIQLFEEWDAVLDNMRLLPRAAESLPAALCVASNAQYHIIDLRTIAQSTALSEPQRQHINSLARPIASLDELFVALNS